MFTPDSTLTQVTTRKCYGCRPESTLLCQAGTAGKAEHEGKSEQELAEMHGILHAVLHEQRIATKIARGMQSGT